MNTAKYPTSPTCNFVCNSWFRLDLVFGIPEQELSLLRVLKSMLPYSPPCYPIGVNKYLVQLYFSNNSPRAGTEVTSL